MVGAEAVPFSSSGGLGDVMGSLPAAIKENMTFDDDIRVILPLHEITKNKYMDKLTFVGKINVKLAWRNQYCGIFQCNHNGVIYYFVDNEYYFKRADLYGNFDDGEKYAFFCKAVLEIMQAVNYFPDVLHANDWHTALCVIYLKCLYANQEQYRNIKTLYTIHNIEYQGVFDFSIFDDVFDLAGCDRSLFDYDGNINLTKAAIVCADKVSTVSERYSEELLYRYFSGNLHHILQRYSYKLCGIVNGIDTNYYNPAKDSVIEKKYDWKHLQNKAVCKEAFQKEFGLQVNQNIPIVAVISRLASHKGLDLIKCVFDDIAYENLQFVLLGKGEYEYEEFFRNEMKKNRPNVKIILDYNKDLSRKIYSAADILLMPSKSEPCGLSQMIASRYGVVPVVREVGGLADTIKPYNPFDKESNGFSFRNYNAHEMLHVLNYALSIYSSKPEWEELVKTVMQKDFSWNKSAEKYINLYSEIIGN